MNAVFLHCSTLILLNIVGTTTTVYSLLQQLEIYSKMHIYFRQNESRYTENILCGHVLGL